MRVLLAEDFDDFAERITAMLSPWEAAVTHARDGLEAVNHIEDTSAVFDLVITDLTMPRRTGWHVIEATRVRRPGVPVVMQSGEAGDGWVQAEAARLQVPLIAKWRLEAELPDHLAQLGFLPTSPR